MFLGLISHVNWNRMFQVLLVNFVVSSHRVILHCNIPKTFIVNLSEHCVVLVRNMFTKLMKALYGSIVVQYS